MDHVRALGAMSVVIAASCQVAAASPGQWDSLKYRTGWIHIGDIDAGSGQLATATVWRLHKAGASLRSSIVAAGDVIELSWELKVYIVGYRESGERHRMEHPQDGVVSVSDDTGLRLGPGTFLKIEDVYIESPVGGLQGVWVRVTPVIPSRK